ncbi:glucokinase [Amorphus orientalis]|uniref:Glucokinase n=1 Tax=Amorphus orientalis TaxID=649198 RepID=A0AAE3VSM1_9HYPH|nr:glucokinase [Amorphus orientalis]MDQ0317386.1 glucokinase [Amorphus orientalis]
MARPHGDNDPLAFPVLIADVGGTNARFAMISDVYSEMKHFPTVSTSDYDSPMAAIEQAVLARTSSLPKSIVMAIAGPVDVATIKLTNADWVIDPAELIETFGLDEMVLVNDFEALALALPSLDEGDLIPLGTATPKPHAPRVAIGPGTGLGVSALVNSAGRVTPIPGEGGHISLAPETDEDFELWPLFERYHGRISGEALLSGPGILRIYRAVCALRGVEPAAVAGEDVSEHAEAGDQAAVTAMRLFCTYLGRFAGDLALIFLAHGGVYIAGGIAPKIRRFLADGHFRAAFEAKAPHQAIMKTIPTSVVTHDRPALEGIAAFARTPSRFAISLQGRRFARKDMDD